MRERSVLTGSPLRCTYTCHVHKPALFFSSFFIFFSRFNIPLRSVMPYWKAIFWYSVDGALLRICHTSTSGSEVVCTVLGEEHVQLVLWYLDYILGILAQNKQSNFRTVINKTVLSRSQSKTLSNCLRCCLARVVTAPVH